MSLLLFCDSSSVAAVQMLKGIFDAKALALGGQYKHNLTIVEPPSKHDDVDHQLISMLLQGAAHDQCSCKADMLCLPKC